MRFIVVAVALLAAGSAHAAPCDQAIATGELCEAASERLLERMKAGGLEAVSVVQEVRTGAVIAFAASKPETIDVTTNVLPLSVVKVMTAASWWDHDLPERTFEASKPTPHQVSIEDIIALGSDSAGRELGLALRKAVGTKSVVADFTRYAFDLRMTLVEVSAPTRKRLKFWVPRMTLDEKTNDADWADALSIGEANVEISAFETSRFMQSIGNDGVMLPPLVRERRSKWTVPAWEGERVMKATTAKKLQAAMRATVSRGTATSIKDALSPTGWTMGGKTGTGPGPMPLGPQSDGWFAGLVFDDKGAARFTVATYVKHGGFGGGNAAKISAAGARFLIDGGVAIEKKD